MKCSYKTKMGPEAEKSLRAHCTLCVTKLWQAGEKLYKLSYCKSGNQCALPDTV